MKSLQNTHRLIAGVLSCTASVALANAATVIDFNEADDMLLFKQAASAAFWSHTANAGLADSPGLVGANGGTPGWMTYQVGFDGSSPSFSGGIYFKLANPTSTSSGYSIFYGIAGSDRYELNTTTVPDTTKTHYAASLQYSSSAATRRFRTLLHLSDQGSTTIATDEYHTIPMDGWYFLGLSSEFDAALGEYTLTVTLRASDDQGMLGEELSSATASGISLPGLQSTTTHYAFFGIDGRAELRGIQALDNFTYQPIPEPATAAFIGTGMFACLMFRRWLP